jgi:hypothetical protein
MTLLKCISKMKLVANENARYYCSGYKPELEV